MRNYIRHPTDIPIEFQVTGDPTSTAEDLNNVSCGGLSFRSRAPLAEGAVIRLTIPHVRPVFEALGRVIWCLKYDDHYQIGTGFLSVNDAFKARMVEQVCHIQQYKQEVLDNEGRVLSGQEAALEWIEKYAKGFPNLEKETSS